jgi:hypothetical protein
MTMTKVDFIFTIGYQGVSAIVDKNARKQYGKLTCKQLAEKGLFKPAFCSALYSGDTDTVELEKVVNIYNRISGETVPSVESMKRLLGVFDVPENISKSIYV